MIAKVKARYAGGVLVPLEPLDLEEGEEVTLSVEETLATTTEGQVVKEGAKEGTLAGVLALVREMKQQVPPEEWEKLPTDGAKNKKHYLYGHPKVED